MTVHTDVDVGLVTSEGSVVPYTVHVSAGALHAQSILDGVDATLVARGAHENSREARHGVLESNNSGNERRRMDNRQLAAMEWCGGVV